jgi:hypothetical protein
MSKPFNSEQSGEDSKTSVLRKAFGIVETSVCLALVLSELFFLLLVNQEALKYPENVFVTVFILSLGFGLISRYLSWEKAVLTFYASTIAVIFVVDWIFGSSADPSIIRDYFGLSIPSGEGVFYDFLGIGLVGGGLWMMLLTASKGAIDKLRRRPIKGVRLSLQSSISRLIGFFDTHPWLATILMGVITLVIGIIIGRLNR